MSLYESYVPAPVVPSSPTSRADRERLMQDAEARIDALAKVDWPQTIVRITARGVSLRRIALAVGVSLPAVQGWAAGSVPSYEAGVRLLQIVEEIDKGCCR